MKPSKTPVNIITGFLGAGKTTAIIHLLQSKKKGEKWAIVINEFGNVSIDFEWLFPFSSTNEQIFEISGGCICCSAKNYFFENLKEVVRSDLFDRIIIEPSGLGGVDMISEQIKHFDNLELMPVVALTAFDWQDNERIQRNLIYQAQLQQADIIVLTKCDNPVAHDKRSHAIDRLRQKYPGKLGYYTSEMGIIRENILDQRDQNEQKKEWDRLTFMSEELSDKKYSQKIFSYGPEVLFDISIFKYLLNGKPGIIRAKGFINTTEGWMFFQIVNNRTVFEPVESKEASQIVIILEDKPVMDELIIDFSIVKQNGT